MSDANRPTAGDLLWEHLGIDRKSPLTEIDFQRALEQYRQEFENDPTSCLKAFQALSLIGGQIVGLESEEPKSAYTVPVPWWIVEAIGSAWYLYETDEFGKTFDQCAGLIGIGQGKKPLKMNDAAIHKCKMLAFDVEARRRRHGETVEVARAAVAAHYNFSEETVAKAHKRFGKIARKRFEETEAQQK